MSSHNQFSSETSESDDDLSDLIIPDGKLQFSIPYKSTPSRKHKKEESASIKILAENALNGLETVDIILAVCFLLYLF